MNVKVIHSESKPAWNIVNTILGGKYKLVNVPYVRTGVDPEVASANKEEARKLANYLANCINKIGGNNTNSPLVVGTLDQDTASKIDKMFKDIASSQDPIPDPKPHIGIMPEHLWKEERFRELKEVIRHYLDADFPLPKDWVTWTTEYNKLLNTIKHEQ